MFAKRFFPARYFAERYFPPTDEETLAPGRRVGAPPHRAAIEQHTTASGRVTRGADAVARIVRG